MAGRIRPSSVGQQLEAIFEKREQLRSRKCISPPGSQFDRQRDAVLAAADLSHHLYVGVVQLKTLMGVDRPLDEELYRRELDCLGDGERFPLQWCRKGPKPPHRFAICAERLSAGGDHMELRRSAHDIRSD